eukprot:891174-Prymnesium_polylepis.1
MVVQLPALHRPEAGRPGVDNLESAGRCARLRCAVKRGRTRRRRPRPRCDGRRAQQQNDGDDDHPHLVRQTSH